MSQLSLPDDTAKETAKIDDPTKSVDDPVLENDIDDQEVDNRVRKVKFTDVEVVMCSLRISGNPACSDYVALELDREVGRNAKMSVEEFEESRPESRRRRDTHLRLTRFDREEILNFYGVSDIEEFVMELRAELRSYEESEKTKMGGRLINRAKSMISGSQEANDDDEDYDDFECDDEDCKTRMSWRSISQDELVKALDLLETHRHVFTTKPAQKTPQPSSASDCTSSGSTSETSLGSFSRKGGMARTLVLEKSREDEVSSEYSYSNKSDKESKCETNFEVAQNSSSSVSSKGSTTSSSKFSKFFKGKKVEKSPKAKKNMRKATDLYLMSGAGFGPLGSL